MSGRGETWKKSDSRDLRIITLIILREVHVNPGGTMRRAS